MKKLTCMSLLLLSLSNASFVQAHPECPKREFWGKTPEACEPHEHENTAPTLASKEEAHIILFDFDSAIVPNIDDITDYIDNLESLERIMLTGHADRLGESDYNVNLSQQRVTAVARRLENSGIPADKIDTDFKGENVPSKTCDGERSPELIECLYNNRRVEVTIIGKTPVSEAP